jgi:hypothetical protein
MIQRFTFLESNEDGKKKPPEQEDSFRGEVG